MLPASFERYNACPGAGLDATVADRLREHYESHDEALAALLGAPPVWRR
ncbi:MAG: hypothetical protein R2734_14555 [Nocardioides sp.]